MQLDNFDFSLVSPDSLLFSSKIEMVTVPGSEGYMGVLPGHAPVLSSLRPGLIEIYKDGLVSNRYFLNDGFVSIEPSRCIVLVEKVVVLDKTLSESDLEKKISEIKKSLIN